MRKLSTTKSMNRTTIAELALYFHCTRKDMAKILKKSKVDLSDIGSIINFAVCQAGFEVGRQMEVRQEQTN